MTLRDRLASWLVPQPAKTAKAVTSLTAWTGGPPLQLYSQEPQQKAKAYLQAYKVGWFYKAGKKIADDISTLDWSVSDGDAEEGDAENTLPRPDLRAPFASLGPIDQFQRLLERPNPSYTGRQLLRKTQVRLDFAGAAFWYLENATVGLPTAIYGISPARMWPSRDSKGNLIGWVMDRDAPSGGVPFDVNEILNFTTGNAEDDEIWGVSVVEAVYSQVPLTDLMARHQADTLALGGRLSGMLWPKDRALTEDEFIDAQRAWRNVASDPNAARRMLIFPEPMEWAQGAATPEQIGIPDLATLNRDEILTAFPISPYRLGVPAPGGLNSGQVREEDRRDYWEDTIHPRADLLEETIQVGLVSKYEDATGQTLDFEIAEPSLDNPASLAAKSDAYKGLVAIGLDPKESLTAVGLAHIKWLGLPALLDPAQQAMAQEQARQAQLSALSQRGEQQAAQMPPSKAHKARSDVAAAGTRALSAFLEGQRDRIVSALRATLPASKAGRVAALKADPEWWNAKIEDAELAGAVRVIYQDASRSGLQAAADQLQRIVPSKAVRRILQDLLDFGGQRIADINANTLAAIRGVLAEGVRRGYSIAQLVDGVPAEGFSGVLQAGLDNGVPIWSDARAETIARTETALSYNRATLGGYQEFDVAEVQAIDGDDDEVCAERNGQVFSVEEAFSIDDHPNGTLDWVPVIDKAAHQAAQEDHMADLALKALELANRPQPDIHVHTTPPDVELPAPIVNVEPPDLAPIKAAIEALRDDVKALKPPVVNVPAPVVNVPAPLVTVTTPTVTDVRVTALPDRAHKIIRDRQGKPTGSLETDA